MGWIREIDMGFGIDFLWLIIIYNRFLAFNFWIGSILGFLVEKLVLAEIGFFVFLVIGIRFGSCSSSSSLTISGGHGTNLVLANRF